MQTITTKYLPATNMRGSRIKATTTSGISVIISYPYGDDPAKAHWLAAKTLINEKLPGEAWRGDYVQGDLVNGFVFVFADDIKRSY